LGGQSSLSKDEQHGRQRQERQRTKRGAEKALTLNEGKTEEETGKEKQVVLTGFRAIKGSRQKLPFDNKLIRTQFGQGTELRSEAAPQEALSGSCLPKFPPELLCPATAT
jgi:hypothetical protein